MSTNPDNAGQQNNRASYSQNLTLLAGLTSDQQQQLACEQGQHRSEPAQRAQSQSIKAQNQLRLIEPSPTHLLSRPEEPQQQQPKHKRDKKKCRGNRKGQRYRAKLRKRRLNDQQIANLEQNYKNMKHSIDIQSSIIPEIDIVALVPIHTQTDIPENQHALQRKSIKRKRETRPVGITTSLSQMSISNLPEKRSRSTSMAPKVIWQATKDKLQAEEEVAILKQRIYTKRLPASDAILDYSIDPIENMLKQPALNKDKRATLSFRRLKTIAQFKYDMMVLTIATAEETVRSHISIIANEKKKLIDNTSGGQVPLPKPLIQLMNAITARQTNMVQRSQYILQQKLSVFDNAPVAENMAGATGAIFEKDLTKNCISASDQRAKDFFTDIENLLRRLHTNILPPKLLARAQHEHRIMKSTRRQLKKSNVIIRITDKSKVFHLGSVQDYHEKALQYMQDTNAYREITSGINPCHDHVQTVLALIDPMLKKREINLELWKQYMRPNPMTTELAHLYFIPKPHKIGTPLRPIVSSIKAAATAVSHFLDLLLRPMFNRVTKETTFINGIDFVRQMESYRDSGRLLPTTLFVTFDVSNLYTMIPRDGAIFALQKFLYKYAENRRVHGMTIDTITRLARLVLDTNCFVYEKKYYQQIRGGAMGSPFTMTLANIYMWEWEYPLIEHQKMHNELYGRYIDDVFMTTNLSIDQIKARLNIAHEQDENIRITCTIGSTVEFLDVLVDNNQ
ncbi:unnamed protein product, partial [Rotaria sordida]